MLFESLAHAYIHPQCMYACIVWIYSRCPVHFPSKTSQQAQHQGIEISECYSQRTFPTSLLHVSKCEKGYYHMPFH